MGGCSIGDTNRKYVFVDWRQGFVASGMATKRVGAGWTIGQRGWLSADYAHFGDKDYAEQSMTVECGMNVSEVLNIAVEGRYCRLGTSDGYYPTERWMALAAKVVWAVGNRLSLSALAGTRPWDDARPWRMHLNAVFTPSRGLLAVVELESEEEFRFRMGMEYRYRDHFFFRAGMSTAPLTLTCGAGVRYERYHIDLGIENHNTLGVTPQISLVVCF